jgi:hypothetical protein
MTEQVRSSECSSAHMMDSPPDFVNAFFRNMRAVLQETNDQVVSLSVALPERVTKEDLEAKVEEMIKRVTK